MGALSSISSVGPVGPNEFDELNVFIAQHLVNEFVELNEFNEPKRAQSGSMGPMHCECDALNAFQCLSMRSMRAAGPMSSTSLLRSLG